MTPASGNNPRSFDNPGPTNLLIRAHRLTRLLLHFVRGIATAGLLFPLYDDARRDRSIVRWANKLVRILHVTVEVHGDPPMAGMTIAANHVSWLDIFIIQSILPARFVAKSEIRGWPLAGWLCARAGTLFIERGRRHHTAEINRAMQAVTRAGGTVALFPEGTTGDGDVLKKFHSALFQAAVESQVPLVPVALRYVDGKGRRTLAAAYVDEINLVQSIGRIIATPQLRAVLHFAPAIATTGKTRRELTKQTHTAIASLLYPSQPT